MRAGLLSILPIVTSAYDVINMNTACCQSSALLGSTDPTFCSTAQYDVPNPAKMREN